MEKYYMVYVSGELKKYTLKEHGSSPKIATVSAIWRLVNHVNKVGTVNKEKVNDMLVKIKKYEQQHYYNRGYILCMAVCEETHKEYYYAYAGSVDVRY